MFVAFFGYRMLFGQTPSVRDGVLALVKIGIVLALATSWAAYRTLVYDVALHGPAEVAAAIGAAVRPARARGAASSRGSASPTAISCTSPLWARATPPPSRAGRPARQRRRPAGGRRRRPSTRSRSGGARILYLTGAIAGLAAVRLVAGLLLALGPFFIAFLLFDGTRGLFDGWISALGAIALGALGIAILLGVELALIEPWLADLIAIRTAGLSIPGAAIELFVVTLVFALVMLAMVYAAAKVALGFRLPDGWRALPARLGSTLREREARLAGIPQQARAAPAEDRSRAAPVADAVAATQRREAGPAGAAARASAGAGPVAPSGGSRRRDGRTTVYAGRTGAARAELSPPHRERESPPAPDAGIARHEQAVREALDAYYTEAGSWAQDRQVELVRSRRTAWLVAWIAIAVAVLLAIALVVLMPLKTVQTVTLLIDRKTGFVQVLDPLDPERITPDTALTQSFLVQYVIARESFDIDTVQTDYRQVALWSAGEARSTYVASHQAGNPESPLARYPRTTVVETRVKSVSSIGRNVAMVRFETRRRDPGGQAQPPRPWVAVIRYRYSGEPMQLEDRMVNPLGFQVLRYRRDPEAPPPPEPGPQPVQPVVIRQVPVAPAPQPAQPQQQQPPRGAGGGAVRVVASSSGLPLCAAAGPPAQVRPRARRRRSAHPDRRL